MDIRAKILPIAIEAAFQRIARSRCGGQRLLFAATLVLLTLAMPLPASIIGGSVTGGDTGGTFVTLTPPLLNPFGAPNSVGTDNFQSPNLYGFDEDQNVELLADLFVDVGTGPLLAGTIVASHYIFFDPAGDGVLSHVVGTVDFDSEVLAIVTSTGLLADSDFLANTGVNYLNPTLRGLEAGDSVFISGLSQITVDLYASTPGDYVRVLTAASPPPSEVVPEPASLLLIAGGLVVLGALRRRGEKPQSPEHAVK